MKVFLAGATGVIGHRAVSRLVEAGHEVSAVARTSEKAALLRGLGAEPVAVDLFDADAVRAAVDGHDAAVNLATHIPPASRSALPGSWAENDRIRREVSAHLANAVLDSGASVFVQESITFPYADRGDSWIDEDTPIDAPAMATSTAAAEAAARRVAEAGRTGIVLRFAQFYAADSAHSISFVKATRKRLAPVLGRADSYISSIHADDAASAVVATLTAPSGTYNVADDEPVTRRVYAEALATALGVKAPHFAPASLAKLGGSASSMLARSQRISNQRFKRAAGWSPRYENVRVGWPAVVAELGERERSGA